MCRGATEDTGQTVPSDYVLTQLESLSQLLSYCLLDSSASSGGVAATPPLPSSSSTLAGAQQQQVECVWRGLPLRPQGLLPGLPQGAARLEQDGSELLPG